MRRLAVLIAFVAVLTLSPRATAPARAPERGARCGSLAHVSGWHTHTVGVIKAERYTHDTALALGPHGRASALWVDGAGLRAAWRSRHWHPARTLDSKAESLGTLAAISSSGAFAAGWRSSPKGVDATISTLAGRAGAALGRPRIMQRDGRHSDLLGVPVTAMAADGGALASWRDTRGALAARPDVLFTASLEPGAAGFGRRLALSIPVGSSEPSGVAAAAGGRALVAAVSAGNLDYGERGPDGRWRFGTQIGNFPPAVDIVVGAALGPGGEAIVLAGRFRAELWASVRPGGSDEFSVARPLSTRLPITGAAFAPEPDGGAVVAWVERRHAEHFGHVRVAAARAGEPFGPTADFRGAGATPRQLSLAALDGGSAIAGWTLDCAGRGTHVLIGRREAGGSLSQPREISDARARPVPPAVALDRTGKPAVLWTTRRPDGRPVLRVSRSAE